MRTSEGAGACVRVAGAGRSRPTTGAERPGRTAMKTMKGPAIFLAQFAGDKEPFNSLPAIAKWAAGHGYEGVQIPSWDARLFDLKRAAESDAYCDEVKGTLRDAGVEVTELSTHLQGQLVAVHPAYDEAFDA